MLPKISSRTQAQQVKSSPIQASNDPSLAMSSTIPLQLPVTPRELQSSPAVDITLPNLTVPPPANPVQLTLPNTNMPPPVVLPNLSVPPPGGSAASSTPTIPLNLPKPKSKISPPMTSPVVAPLIPPGTAPVIIPPGVTDPKPASVLSSLSEEELIRKANEMLGEAEPTREDTSPEPDEEPAEGNADGDDDEETDSSAATAAFKSAPIMYTPPPVLPSPAKRTKLDVSQPPVPGLEDEEY